MAHFDFIGDEVSIIDDDNHRVRLNPQAVDTLTQSLAANSGIKARLGGSFWKRVHQHDKS